MSGPNEFDWSAAMSAVCNDRDLLRDVVEVLVSDLPRLRGNLVNAFASQDTDAIRRGAHSLKGSLRFLGDIAGHRLSQQLEDLGTDGAFADCVKVWGELQAELDGLNPVLESFLASKE